jgi:hypothetical protein
MRPAEGHEIHCALSDGSTAVCSWSPAGLMGTAVHKSHSIPKSGKESRGGGRRHGQPMTSSQQQ